eukprot:CAMPEP_0203938170 /NCGR_PEP_ID=MMETSP0359-20131031/75265_1 /ASSEMBLY_ACC=CAM_ASM_000338 /TAXON_ID=268821 /ORGANISM="Scrippsiella Hangoei, Strain SHTV-5" /LENGTH=138 /DNA_ID=CAMNT_0050868343 /DNA_START=127 /DNA_END=539 /DNA_ORIENTATION=-
MTMPGHGPPQALSAQRHSAPVASSNETLQFHDAACQPAMNCTTANIHIRSSPSTAVPEPSVCAAGQHPHSFPSTSKGTGEHGIPAASHRTALGANLRGLLMELHLCPRPFTHLLFKVCCKGSQWPAALKREISSWDGA